MEAVKQDMGTLTVRLPKDLRKRFKQACVTEDRDMSVVVREFIEWWTRKREETA